MEKRIKSRVYRTLPAVLLITFWIIMIRVIIQGEAHGTGLLGFLSGAAFLIFSVQWSFRQLMQTAPEPDQKTKV